MYKTWCNHLSRVPVPPGLCECFLNAWDTHSEGSTTPSSTLPMPRSTSDREKVLTCKEDSCNNALLAVSWKQVTPSLMTSFRKKANTQGCTHLSQVITAVSHGWNCWGFSTHELLARSPRWGHILAGGSEGHEGPDLLWTLSIWTLQCNAGIFPKDFPILWQEGTKSLKDHPPVGNGAKSSSKSFFFHVFWSCCPLHQSQYWRP